MTYGDLDEKLHALGLSLHLSAKGRKWKAVLKNGLVRIVGHGSSAEAAIGNALHQVGEVRGKHR